MFLDQFGAAGCPQIWPRGAQIGQKCPKIAISSSGGLKRLEQHGTKVEQVRGGPCRSFWTNLVQQGAPKFDAGAPEMAKIGPKCPKNGKFLGFCGLKRFEQRGTKVEWVQKLRLGFPSTHSTLVLGCPNRFGPPKP